MERKIKSISAGAFKFLVCLVFIILFSETAFAQVSGLTLNPQSDLRIEMVYFHNTLIGYNLFVRKKPGMESVMLTEPTGNYALRSLVWYPPNGDEIRKLSGAPLSDPYSRYSILSSTPISDGSFDKAFRLFIPLKIVYGNPSYARGSVYQDVIMGFQFNIRTFDHKYADPNRGRFQNNPVMMSTPVKNTREARYHEFVPANPSSYNADKLRKELREKIESDDFLNEMDDDLKNFLIYLFWEMERR